MSSKKPYYHYTNVEAAKAICKSRVILMSGEGQNADAVFGPGVYLTRKPPSTSKFELAWNNWDGLNIDALLADGRADAYIKVMLDDSDVEKCRTPDGRDVYRYPGKDLRLTSDMKPAVGHTSN